MSSQHSDRRIVRVAEACVDCGACVGQCKTGALSIDETTYRIDLDAELCSACGLCIEACAFSAIFAIGTRVAADTRTEDGHVACSQL